MAKVGSRDPVDWLRNKRSCWRPCWRQGEVVECRAERLLCMPLYLIPLVGQLDAHCARVLRGAVAGIVSGPLALLLC